MPENILRKMNIEFVEHKDEVMEKALLDKPDEDDADLAFIQAPIMALATRLGLVSRK